MKKVPFYRRVNGANAGMKEKIAWQLSKRPMTGAELSEILKIPLPVITCAMSTMLKQTQTARINAGPDFKTENGLKDRLYTLAHKPKRIAKTPKVNIPISPRSLSFMLNGQKDKNIEAAAKRRKLIESGIYCDWMK